MAIESITLYKLLTLYMLDRVDFPLSNATITGFVLETGYTDFATIQQVLGIIQMIFILKETEQQQKQLLFQKLLGKLQMLRQILFLILVKKMQTLDVTQLSLNGKENLTMNLVLN